MPTEPTDPLSHPDDHLIDIELIEDEDELLAIPPVRSIQLTPELRQRIATARLMSADAVTKLPPPEWFIEDLLPFAPRTMLHGLGGSYKSFVMLDWMLSASTHLKWQGHEVRPGKVLYIAGEGLLGLGKRLTAWCRRNGFEPHDLDANFDIMGSPINLGETKHTAIWQGFFDYMRYDYVVVDTLHMASAGSEENSSTEMGRVLENATRMIGPDTSIFYVHHTIKSGTGHRGSGALRDDMDVVVGLAPVDGADLTAQLTADKIRDGERFKPINITFAKVGEGVESSLIVDSITENASRQEQKKAKTSIDLCCDAIIEHGIPYDPQGADSVYAALLALDLGYKFSRPRTVGPAIKRLRAGGQEVKDMLARKPKDIELEPEDR